MELPENFNRLTRTILLEHMRRSAEVACDEDEWVDDNWVNWGAALLGLSQFSSDRKQRLMINDALEKLDHGFWIRRDRADNFCFHAFAYLAETCLDACDYENDHFDVIEGFDLANDYIKKAISLDSTNELYHRSLKVISEAKEMCLKFASEQECKSFKNMWCSLKTSFKQALKSPIANYIKGKSFETATVAHEDYVHFLIFGHSRQSAEAAANNDPNAYECKSFKKMWCSLKTSFKQALKSPIANYIKGKSFETATVACEDFVHFLIFEHSRQSAEAAAENDPNAYNFTKLGGALLGLSLIQSAQDARENLKSAISILEKALAINCDKADTLCYLCNAYTALGCLTSDIAQSMLYFDTAKGYIQKAMGQDTNEELYDESSAVTSLTLKIYTELHNPATSQTSGATSQTNGTTSRTIGAPELHREMTQQGIGASTRSSKRDDGHTSPSRAGPGLTD